MGLSDRGLSHHTTHRERLDSMLAGSSARLRADDKLIDIRGEVVGEVAFDAKKRFTAGRFYGMAVVAGRTRNPEQALAEFETLIERHK